MTQSLLKCSLQCMFWAATIVLIGCGDGSADRPGAQASAAGMTYESLAKLPDWRGAWAGTVRPTAPVTEMLLKEPSPLKPAALEDLHTKKKAMDAGLDPGLGAQAYCRPFAY